MQRSRRRALAALGLSSVGLVGLRCGIPRWLRRDEPQPLTPDEQAFVDERMQGVDTSRLWDVHCHLVGRGVGSDCRVSDELTSRFHPWKNLQFDVYAAAAGLAVDEHTPDSHYVDRLVRMQQLTNPDGRLVLLAFDRFVDEDGNEDAARSELFTSNQYSHDVAKAHPQEFVAGCSVHPYRRDAVDRLQQAAAAGARICKWLPNAMGIDPASPRCVPFYAALKELGMPLLTHTGDESAVDARDMNAWGDPQRLQPALRMGVHVVAAHVATTGVCGDVACVQSVLDLMRAHANLWADLSAVTQTNRMQHLPLLLEAGDVHPRLLHGSDYPLPAIDPLISTRQLVRAELLDATDRAWCNRIFDKNPLLFDLVLKRCLRTHNGARFSNACFETVRLWEAASA
jgi:uncharacterized protein